MSLHHTAALLTLASANFASLVQFYRRLLTQEPAVYRPNVYAEFHLAGLRLGIFHPKQESEPGSKPAGPQFQPPSSQQHLNSPMALCLEVTDLEAAIAHLTQLGYPPPGDILTASHGREIYAYDPDGNWLILHQGNGG